MPEPLRRIGALWRSREGQPSAFTGTITVNGLKQRVVVFANEDEFKETDPAYVIKAGEPPTPDTFERDRAAKAPPATGST